MTGTSDIEWTDATWNPTTGCDKVSPGCDNCYALRMAKRLKGMGSARYQRDGDPKTSGPGFGLSVHPDALDWPLRKTKPLRIFVNSMSDLFHKDVPDEFIARVWATMALAPQHTFQVLTKRHGRMRSLLNRQEFQDSVWAAGVNIMTGRIMTEALPWPLPNVWLGVSVEDQKRADLRIPALLDTPAAVRFLSCEPLLGPVDLAAVPRPACVCNERPIKLTDTKSLPLHQRGCPALRYPWPDWVIVGGESGAGARPMHPEWARSLRDQCVAAGVAFHFKQWGNHGPDGEPVHKKVAGRELDGRTWDEFPQKVGA